MRIVRFLAGSKTRYGLLTDNTVQVIRGKPYAGIVETGERLPLKDIKLLVPCAPSKIVALGLNYVSHANEFKNTLPKNPLLFLKPSTAVIGPGDNIVLPPSSTRVDYEAELGVVIGKKCHQASEAEALEYVLGYTCCNDVSARDHQKDDVQWTRAKGHDTFAPIGPWIETDLDPGQVTLEAWRNGKLVQQGHSRDLIFGVPRLIAFISDVMTLLPGDIIATGTPAGVGEIRPGDTIEIRLSGIGSLKNNVVKRD